jgi:uncharacterized damage-inducible protein DinB
VTVSDVPAPAALIALATELEKEGQYNAAKLVRAVALAETTRDGYRVRAAAERSEQAAALDDLAARLAGSPAVALAPALRAAADALRRGGVALAGEAPDPCVCRICGQVSAGPLPGRCPVCGRWPTTAERVRAIYWSRESTPPEALEALRAAPSIIAKVVEGASEEQLQRPPADGGWSAHQTLSHLHNAQGVFRGRIDQLVAGGDPVLESVMVWKMDGAVATFATLFEAYRELRAEIVAALDRVEPTAFWHTGRHEEWGRVSLAEQASYFANHEPTHLAQLADAIG